jgi:hypothetical protein
MTNQNTRDSFIFYRSFYEAIKSLPEKEQLEIYNAIAEYSLNFNEMQLEKSLSKTIFILIKPQLDANNKRYIAGQKGAEHGKKGGRPKKQKPQNNPIGDKKNYPKETPNKNDNVNVECIMKNDNKECKSKSELPDFINPEIFKDFKNMRKKMKKEMTERAEKMIIKKLKGFEELTSGDANIALEQSILKNYTDVYEPKASTTKTTGIDFKKLNLSNREQHTADLINKMINATLINRISIKNSNLACFHTTKENKEKLNNLPEDQKQEIRKIVKDNFGIKEIEYIY